MKRIPTLFALLLSLPGLAQEETTPPPTAPLPKNAIDLRGGGNFSLKPSNDAFTNGGPGQNFSIGYTRKIEDYELGLSFERSTFSARYAGSMFYAGGFSFGKTPPRDLQLATPGHTLLLYMGSYREYRSGELDGGFVIGYSNWAADDAVVPDQTGGVAGLRLNYTFNINRHFGISLQPGYTYYFMTDFQIHNISGNIGLRARF